MCGSMADIQSATAEIRRRKKERTIERQKKKRQKKKPQSKNIMACPITYSGHNKWLLET